MSRVGASRIQVSNPRCISPPLPTASLNAIAAPCKALNRSVLISRPVVFVTLKRSYWRSEPNRAGIGANVLESSNATCFGVGQRERWIRSQDRASEHSRYRTKPPRLRGDYEGAGLSDAPHFHQLQSHNSARSPTLHYNCIEYICTMHEVQQDPL